MKITCISASNTKKKGRDSASTKVCELISDLVLKDDEVASVEVVPLMNYDLKPCTLCGHCGKDSKCMYNDGFNELYEKIIHSDLIFIVVPFYSAIPSKLTIVFEKLNEILYANWINDNQYTPPFKGIPVGIVGHGGMPQGDKVVEYYHDHLITPAARTLKSLSFNVISMNDRLPNGVAFGLEDENSIQLNKPEHLIFPEIKQNYDMIRSTIKPYINYVLNKTLSTE